MNLIDQLGIIPIKFEETKYEVHVELNDYHAQPEGFLNGSVSLALAEISSGMASNNLLNDGYFAFGQSISAEHLRAMKSVGLLIVKGELLHRGRTSHVWEVKIYDDRERLISHATVTNHIQKLN
ncbi:PaaI family thioesterase [Lactovum miscens]|uniref:Uncharacterized protein (TIGR00369 family) n=1 Tax=Lactovum miscens TaxID=190387 RepID=A0A841C4N4_9LACT|nr:PaaI family thioesterase [Lactovum miscens]MBB5887217.1 uncharacterized protein (TIGR00369 family) [Lactovum miscens]